MLEIDALGTPCQDPTFVAHTAKRDRRYVPSYDWGSPTLGDRHERIANAVWSIPGWLASEDALKLYELAYFSTGPILEIGTYCGRSTVVMATAVSDRPNDIPVISLDIDAAIITLAHRALRDHGVAEHVLLVCDSLRGFLRALPEFAPSLVFVDANHSAASVAADLEALASCVVPGTLILLHDYLCGPIPDTTGFPVSPRPIDVAEAVHQSWLVTGAEFCGTFGWSGLYRVPEVPYTLNGTSHRR